MNISRRTSLKGMALAGASFAMPSQKKPTLKSNTAGLEKGSVILFQGDSITDAGRSRAHYYANNAPGMGSGYVRQIVTHLMGAYPTLDLQFYNRGISGHKVFQLRDRWNDDCLMLKPDVLSIMIGVNDFWHTLDYNYDGNEKIYEHDLNALLTWTKKELPEVKIIMGEPFVCHEGTSIKPELWKGKFEKYQAACRKVSDSHGAAFVPYQQVFDDAIKIAPSSYWTPDGVHPSMAGNALMAKAWLAVFENVIGD